jgi:hypothetical protein
MEEVAGEATVDGHALYAKISWRLIPYIFCCISWLTLTA